MAALSGINNLLFIGFLFKALASFRASQRFLNSPGVKIIPNVKFSGNTLKVLNVDGGAAPDVADFLDDARSAPNVLTDASESMTVKSLNVSERVPRAMMNAYQAGMAMKGTVLVSSAYPLESAEAILAAIVAGKVITAARKLAITNFLSSSAALELDIRGETNKKLSTAGRSAFRRAVAKFGDNDDLLAQWVGHTDAVEQAAEITNGSQGYLYTEQREGSLVVEGIPFLKLDAGTLIPAADPDPAYYVSGLLKKESLIVVLDLDLDALEANLQIVENATQAADLPAGTQVDLDMNISAGILGNYNGTRIGGAVRIKHL